MIGHNSASFGETIRSAVGTVLPDDHKKLFYFVKWNLSDYITGTQGMEVEQEGAYMRFLVRLYDRGKPFPDDDRFMCTVMGMQIRVWRRLKLALIEIGKIICRNGCLTNIRFEREREKRAAELRTQADAARERWRKQRQKNEVSAKFGESLAETSPNISKNFAKKVNEINDAPLTTHMPSRVQSLESKDNKPASTEREAECERAGVNAVTDLMVMRVAKWMNQYQPDYTCAREWIASMLTLHGEQTMRSAFAEMESKIAQKEIIGKPMKLLNAICQRLSTEKAEPINTRGKYNSSANNERQMPDFVRRKIEEDERRHRESLNEHR